MQRPVVVLSEYDALLVLLIGLEAQLCQCVCIMFLLYSLPCQFPYTACYCEYNSVVHLLEACLPGDSVFHAALGWCFCSTFWCSFCVVHALQGVGKVGGGGAEGGREEWLCVSF